MNTIALASDCSAPPLREPDARQATEDAAQQTMSRLAAHLEGLDTVVRDELRRAFIDECGALIAEAHGAMDALGRLKRVATVRLGLIAVLMAVLWSLTSWSMWMRYWPSEQELAALRRERAQLSSDLEQLAASGARAHLRRCGRERRLCVQIDRGSPVYGTDADYLIIKGY